MISRARPSWLLSRFAAMAIPAVLLVVPAQAADFYAGKSLKLAVSSDAGGGYDLYTRILARYIPRYLPGAPATIVQNFPGAGGLRGAHYLYQTAAKDGTEFGEIHATTMLDAILGRTGDEIDPTRYAWIGSIASDSDVCSFWKTSGIRTFENMLTQETVIGSVGKGDQATTFPTVINNVLHTKMKIIMGYKGTGDRLLALERGELTGSCGINASTLMSIGQKQIEDGDLIPVVQSGLVRQRAFPNVPLTQSFARSDEQRLILETIFSQMAIARAYAAPPGVPAEQVALLRTAFSRAVHDPDFLADAVKAKVEISPMSGEDVQQLIAKLAGISGDLKSKVTAALGD